MALTSGHSADADLDDLLIALRGALGLGASAPMAGLVVRTTGDKAGILLGDAQYLSLNRAAPMRRFSSS